MGGGFWRGAMATRPVRTYYVKVLIAPRVAVDVAAESREGRT
jgi:hypothetical protein